MTVAATSDFAERLAETAARVERALETLLGEAPLAGERVRPRRLLDAMRHAVLGGGKRLRPFLLLETARLFGRDDEGALRAACALECLHCYSLVHDDLPAMDDDDLRRGRPTVHRAFDEATAILAGDALLTFAFDLLADPQTDDDAAKRADLVLDLARAAGLGGMAGGQMLDLMGAAADPDEAGIRQLQSMKTGALLRYACRAGARLGDGGREDLDRLTRFGETIGLAFQLADDLLDVVGDAEALGKATGKDIARGKATLVGLHGVDWTRNTLDELVRQADGLLAPFGARADGLRQTARFIAERTN